MAPVLLLRLPVELLENVVRHCDQPERLGRLFHLKCLQGVDMTSYSTPSYMSRLRKMRRLCGSAAPHYAHLENRLLLGVSRGTWQSWQPSAYCPVIANRAIIWFALRHPIRPHAGAYSPAESYKFWLSGYFRLCPSSFTGELSKQKGLRTLTFEDCVVHGTVWMDLLRAPYNNRMRSLHFINTHVHPWSGTYPAQLAESITDLVWRDDRVHTSTEHSESFMRVIISTAPLEKLVLHCVDHAQFLVLLAANTLVHLEVAFNRQLRLDNEWPDMQTTSRTRWPNLRYLVLDIRSHVRHVDFVPLDPPPTLQYLKIVCSANGLFIICAELCRDDCWITQNMTHLVITSEVIRHDWQDAPAMCNSIRLALLCDQIGVRLDVSAGSKALLHNGTLHPGVISSCADCDHELPASKPAL